MASQTDRKEEFRKYLDKGNVLSILTNVLTDLFELDPKPEDPALYVHQKIGEAINKRNAPRASNHADAPHKDVQMKDSAPTSAAPVSKRAEPDATTQQKAPPQSVPTKGARGEHADGGSQPAAGAEPAASAPAAAAAAAAAAGGGGSAPGAAPLSVATSTQ